MDYLSRRIEYQNLLREIDIDGEEHLKVILEQPDSYITKANSLKERISSDSFLTKEDRESFLKRINEYSGKVGSNKTNNFWNYLLAFLAGMGIGHVLPSNNPNQQTEFIENALKGFYSELKR